MANNNKMTIIEALVQLRNDLKLWVTNNLRVKLDKNLGKEENADKILATDSEGNVITINQKDVSIDVDSELSDSSENPVQNKAVYNALYKDHNTDDSAHEGIRNDIPTKVSQLENDSKYITGFTESDPLVPAWAKAPTKPEYTYSEVGALPDFTVLADLNDDEDHRTVTDDEKGIWNNKVDKDQGTNNAGKVLLVDGNGQVVVGYPTIEGAVDAAAKLSTPREISLGGDVTGSTTFDGSKDVTINTEIETIINSKIDEIFEGTFYSISYNLSNCTSFSAEEEIYNNEKFITVITPDTGYKIENISITVGTEDVTQSVRDNNIITIPSVTGNIVITATAVPFSTYTITYNLTNCSSSNTETTITEGDSYTTSISCVSPYMMTKCNVDMEGEGEVTASQTGSRKYNINIPEVTGNIVITAIADN